MPLAKSTKRVRRKAAPRDPAPELKSDSKSESKAKAAEARGRGQHELVIISGMSGAGKASALKTFEDLGYYCVDNLPVGLMANFAELVLGHAGNSARRPGGGHSRRRAAWTSCRKYWLHSPPVEDHDAFLEADEDALCCAATAKPAGRIPWDATVR